MISSLRSLQGFKRSSPKRGKGPLGQCSVVSGGWRNVPRTVTNQTEGSTGTPQVNNYGWTTQGIPIERAELPPSAWYTGPEIMAKEKETVFKNNWIQVGRIDQLPGKGDYIAGTFLKEPYIIVRTEEGELKGFFNVCRHHAARIVEEGQGATPEFECPYHGWKYTLDGKLRVAPKVGGIKDFRPKDFGLFPIPVTTWGPWIFMQLNPEAKHDLQSDLSHLDQKLTEMDYMKLKFHKSVTYDINCNWKVFVDNYLDGGYHVPLLHRKLGGLLDLKEYKTDLFPKFSIQTCESGSSEGGDPATFSERLGDKVLYAWVYPNLMINRYGPIMDTNLIIPLSPTKSRVIFDYFFDESVINDQEFVNRSLQESHQVQVEDTYICESVQGGLSSSAYETGRYVPKLEHGEYHFHQSLISDFNRVK